MPMSDTFETVKVYYSPSDYTGPDGGKSPLQDG